MWYFLWDNDAKHTSGIVQQWLHNNGITKMDYPPRSPDINIVENVWNDVKLRVEKRNPNTEAELKLFWQQEWDKTDKNFVIRLAHAMPARCQEIIKAKGGHIKFII